MNRATKVFIVEGENRDLRFVNSLTRLFMSDYDDSIIINVPAAENIYMLYEKLKEDEFETDVIELLRESSDAVRTKLIGISRDSVTELFLLFDADLHSNNVTGDGNPIDALYKMLSVFDNETENGKLYISYPMVEALYDIKEGECGAFSKCFVPIEEFIDYKENAGCGNRMASRHFNSKDEWKKVIQAFYVRTRCLFGKNELSFEEYRRTVSPKTVLDIQRPCIDVEKEVFALSALPEMLLDYFRKDFWEGNVDERVPVKFTCANMNTNK